VEEEAAKWKDRISVARADVAEPEAKVSELTEKITKLHEESKEAQAQIRPVYEQALADLKKLSRPQLTEMKSIKKPSAAILSLMAGVCIVLGVAPKLVRKEGSYTDHDEDWWSSATSSKVLGSPQLLESLLHLQPAELTEERMQKLEQITSQEHLPSRS